MRTNFYNVETLKKLSPATEAKICDQFEALANEVQPLDLGTVEDEKEIKGVPVDFEKSEMNESVSSIAPSGKLEIVSPW